MAGDGLVGIILGAIVLFLLWCYITGGGGKKTYIVIFIFCCLYVVIVIFSYGLFLFDFIKKIL